VNDNPFYIRSCGFVKGGVKRRETACTEAFAQDSETGRSPVGLALFQESGGAFGEWRSGTARAPCQAGGFVSACGHRWRARGCGSSNRSGPGSVGTRRPRARDRDEVLISRCLGCPAFCRDLPKARRGALSISAPAPHDRDSACATRPVRCGNLDRIQRAAYRTQRLFRRNRGPFDQFSHEIRWRRQRPGICSAHLTQIGYADGAGAQRASSARVADARSA
jgi:hypothetical protein